MVTAFMEYLKAPVNIKDKKTIGAILGAVIIFFAIPLTAYFSLQHKNLKIQAAPNGMPALPAHWTGVNVWSIAADENLYDCGGRSATHQQTADNTFQHLHDAGASVVRFFAFQPYAVNSSGQRDWTAMDRVFASAQAHGIYLIPALGNNWNDCDYWPLSLNNYSYGWPQPWYNGFYQPKKSVAIKSSSNAADGIIIETGSPHGFGGGIGTGGWQITIEGHERSQANGKQWDVYIIDATHFKLTRRWPENTAPTPLSSPGGQSGIAYSVGYQDPRNGLPASYRGWVNEIVTRYSQHPTLLAWEVINEPRENTTVLNNFFRDINSVIRAADTTTPVSLGCICHGEFGFGVSGGDMATQYSLPDVGFVTAHDYVPDGSDPNAPMPWYIQADIGVANQLGKPFFVGEMGRDGAFDQTKIDMYKAKMQAAFNAGAVGYLLWAYTDDQPAGSAGYDFGYTSPLMAILNDFAGPGDTTNPTASITSPTSGATVSGTATIQATATDNVGVTRVEFYYDSTHLIGTDTTATGNSYSVSWDTTSGVSNGSHTLIAKAYDAAGNSSTSTSVSVTVSNVQGKVGDLNSDGNVDIYDLSILLSRWGSADPTADLNHSGSVDIVDLSTLISHWGT